GTRLVQEAIIGAGISLLASCTVDAPPGPMPDFELETTWFTVRGYDRDPEDLCGGTLAWLDSYTGALAQALDIPPMTIGAYHWYSQESWDELGICGDAYGCVHLRHGVLTAFSREFPHEHEIVHVALDNLYEPCVAVLSEGLAEHF